MCLYVFLEIALRSLSLCLRRKSGLVYYFVVLISLLLNIFRSTSGLPMLQVILLHWVGHIGLV